MVLLGQGDAAMMQQYRDGDTREIRGVTYVRRGGAWTPQGTGQMQPVIPRQPAPVRPVEQQLDELRLRRETRELETEEGVEVPGDVNLEGEAYLHSLPQSMQTQVRALSEGRIAMPQGRAAATPYWQRIMQAAGHYDPSFDAANYQTRVATRRNFTSGVARRNITSLNTALGHLDTLAQRAAELNNTDYPIVNTVRNFARRQTGDPRIDRFNQTRQAVVDELERAFRGSAGSVTGIEHWRENINTAQSPEQLRGAIQEAIELLGSRLDALGAEYNAGMGRSDDPISLLTPHAQEIMRNLGGGQYGAPERRSQAAPPMLGAPPGDPRNPLGINNITPPTTPSGDPMDPHNLFAPGPPLLPDRGPRAAPGVTIDANGVAHTNTGVYQSSPGQYERSDDTSRNEEPDPVLAGVNRRLGTMIASGAPDAEIRAYVQSVGIPAANLNLDEVLAYRRTSNFREWRRQNPNVAYPVNVERQMTERGPVRAALGSAGNTTPGAYAISAGNMVVGQRLPEIVGATGGNEEQARAGIEEIRSRHPYASIAGDISGGVLTYEGGRAFMNRLPASVASRLPASNTATFGGRNMMGDAALGAYEGSGMNPDNPVEGALTGVGLGVVGGIGGRGAINTSARAISPSGGRLAEVYSEGVQPTIGQRMGGIANRAEQAFESLPVIGQVQRNARQGARDQFERGAFNRTLRFLPGRPELPGDMALGTEPHRFMQDAFSNAYQRVHRRLRVEGDDELMNDFRAIRETAERLGDDSRSRYLRILGTSVLRRLDNGRGVLRGDDLQAAMSDIRQTIRGIRGSASGDRELLGPLEDLEGALMDNARRHSSADAIRTLDNIDTGYAHAVRIEDAANRAGQGEPGRFTARALLNAERRSGGLRGRSFLRGDGLLDKYATSGLRLGQNVADSGTPERLATMGATMGTLGAGSHFVSPWFAAPLVADTVANLPGVKQTVNAALAPNRPSLYGLRRQIEDRARYGGVVGVPLALDLYGQ